MSKSRLKEYKLLEDTNISNGTKVSFKINVNTENLQDDEVQKNIINIINNDIINKLNGSTTAIKLKSRKNTESGVSAEQSGRYALKVKAGLDESTLKINKKSSKNNINEYEVIFTILLSPVSRKKLKSDTIANVAKAVGNTAKATVGAVSNAGATMAPKMTSPYGN